MWSSKLRKTEKRELRVLHTQHSASILKPSLDRLSLTCAFSKLFALLIIERERLKVHVCDAKSVVSGCRWLSKWLSGLLNQV